MIAVTQPRLTKAQGEGLAQGAVVLDTAVVEVVSPESVRRDYRTKRTEYAALGIPEYWIVDPLAGKVSVLVLEDGFYDLEEFSASDLLISRTLPEIRLTVATLLTAGAV